MPDPGQGETAGTTPTAQADAGSTPPPAAPNPAANKDKQGFV